MLSVLTASWPLFLGLVLIMLGNGLQSSLLGIRATDEGFSTSITGFVMSGYFLGFLFGSTLTPRLVASVGHVRVFAALASIASSAVLLHVIFVEPVSWFLMRVMTGFSYAGLYVVAESWLNDRATNETRGQLLAAYMVVVLGGMGGGQMLLNLDDPGGAELFILCSVLISAALVPILLSARPAPSFESTSRVGLLELYRISPLGVVAAFWTGIAQGTVFSLAAVYAGRIGMPVSQIAIFVAMIFLGGMLFQWPIGSLSDKIDRRMLLTAVTFLAAVAAVVGAVSPSTSPIVLFAVMFVFGGMNMPLYSLCVAHTNDYLKPEQMVAASGALYIYVGIGASFGPMLAALLMDFTNSQAYYVFLAVVHAIIGVFAIYRMTRRESVPVEEQLPVVPTLGSTGSVTSTLSAESLRDQMDRDLADMSRADMLR